MDDEDFEDDAPEGVAGFPFAFLGDIPEEIKEQMQANRDRHEMAAEVWRHEVNDLLRGLEPEQLGTLRRIFQNMDPTTCAYYIGVITTLLEVLHGRCGGCGKNHDEDLLAVTQEVHDPDGDPHE